MSGCPVVQDRLVQVARQRSQGLRLGRIYDQHPIEHRHTLAQVGKPARASHGSDQDTRCIGRCPPRTGLSHVAAGLGDERDGRMRVRGCRDRQIHDRRVAGKSQLLQPRQDHPFHRDRFQRRPGTLDRVGPPVRARGVRRRRGQRVLVGHPQADQRGGRGHRRRIVANPERAGRQRQTGLRLDPESAGRRRQTQEVHDKHRCRIERQVLFQKHQVSRAGPQAVHPLLPPLDGGFMGFRKRLPAFGIHAGRRGREGRQASRARGHHPVLTGKVELSGCHTIAGRQRLGVLPCDGEGRR